MVIVYIMYGHYKAQFLNGNMQALLKDTRKPKHLHARHRCKKGTLSNFALTITVNKVLKLNLAIKQISRPQ
jgi:hypothetical protein